MTLSGIALALFAAWLWSARIGGALHLQGRIEPVGGSWKIAHPDGGKIATILLSDGDFVEKDAPILHLDGDDLRAERDALIAQLRTLTAQLARLRSERDGTEDFTLASAPERLQGHQLDTEIQAQRAFKEARARSLNADLAEIDLLRARNADQRALLRAQLAAVEEEAELVATVIASQERLSSQGLTTANRLLPLQQQRAALNRTRLQARGQLAELDTSDETAALRRARLITQRREEVLGEIQTLSPRATALRAQLDILDARLARLTLTAPVSGTIHALQLHHPGALIEPGRPIGAIIPADTPLIAVAQLPVESISQVFDGQLAFLQTPRDAHDGAPPKGAKITYISADSLSPPDMAPFYRIEFSPEAPLTEELRPGMTVQILVQMPAERAITFLTAPISGFFARAFPGRQPSQP